MLFRSLKPSCSSSSGTSCPERRRKPLIILLIMKVSLCRKEYVTFLWRHCNNACRQVKFKYCAGVIYLSLSQWIMFFVVIVFMAILASGALFSIIAPLSDAGWSSLVARRAHNPKVVGSNPAPTTKFKTVYLEIR